MTPNEIIKAMDELSEGIKRKHHDCVTMSQVVPQAAALIREMRGMLRKIEWGRWHNDGDECHFCRHLMVNGHAPDCKLAQMLKD